MKRVKRFQKFIEKIYCTEVTSAVELVFGYLAIIAFMANIIALFLVKSDILDIPQLEGLSYISTISLPFTIILISEIFLLVRSYTKPLIFSLLVQIQVVSLILIRDIFKKFGDLAGLDSASINGIIVEIIFTIIMGVVLFLSVNMIKKYVDSHGLKNIDPIMSSHQLFRLIRQLLSLFLLVGSVGLFISYFTQNISPDPILYVAEGAKLTGFFESVFTLMILADVLIFLVSFIYHEEYPDLFTNVIYLVSSILIRFAINTEYPLNILLVLVSSISAIVITILNSKFKFNHWLPYKKSSTKS